MPQMRIAIIGGGPSGLTLLNTLARHGIAATLYEREASIDSRAHLGGMLDLHEETGQAAMKGAGIWDTFVAHSRPEGEELKITDRTGVPVFHHVPPPDAPPARPEIDRSVLRQILVDAAPHESVKWNHALVSVEPVVGSATAEWALKFANGHTAVADLVVGADGARSRIRPLVSDAAVQYTGLTGVEVSFAADVAAAHPELVSHIGHGSVYAIDDYKVVVTQRNGDGRIRTYYWFTSDDPAVLSSSSSEEVIAEVQARFADWAPWIRELVTLSNPQAIYHRPLYMLPVGHSWAHRAGVTLIGDAMNLMTPFAGEGANIAVYAGMKLGLALAAVREGKLGEMDAAVAKFEDEMCKRAEVETKKTAGNLKLMLAPSGARELTKAFVLQNNMSEHLLNLSL